MATSSAAVRNSFEKTSTSDGDRPLSKIETHKSLVVSRIDLPNSDAVRVKVLGICVGRPVNVVRCGDPLIVNVSGTHVGISRGLADAIFVKTTVAVPGILPTVSL